jgi:general secretion pathway protein F
MSNAACRLKVQAADGRIQTLTFTDVTEADAVRRVVSQGARVLALESGVVDARAVSIASADSRFPLLLFSQELLALLDAGLQVTEALSTLLAKERQPQVARVIAEVLQAVREGLHFSDALAQLPQCFPTVYVATVKACERTGDVPQGLARWMAYQLQFEGVRKKLVSAAIYPAMLLLVGGLVTLFLLGYVVPRFATIYESSGRDLPWLSTVLLSWGRWVAGHGFWALGGLIAALGSLAACVLRAQGRAWLLTQFLRLPGLASKADEFRLARFFRSVSLLLMAGIALPRALGMVDGLLSAAQQTRLARSRLAVEQGQSLSNALLQEDLASPVAESLIKVGERTGQMADMLERAARFADDELSRWIDWASRLLEPILMAVMGVVIGTVVVLMYLPIFDLAGSLQ